MSSTVPPSYGAPPPEKSADEVLPPVTAPTKGFLLQLFFIPMIIVAIIVTVWFMFSWLAQMGTDPADLARNLRNQGSNRWQDAMTLSDLLRNPDFEQLKDNTELARELSDVLQQELNAAGSSAELVKMRVFLCRALGEFRTLEVLPALLQAVRQEKDPADVDVRRSALESIAVLADNVGPEQLRDNEELMDILRAAALDRSTAGAPENRSALRATAAFTLGVVGGDEARNVLARVLDDPNANARYNGATGLARNGDERAVVVLLEMIDPDNEYAVADETTETGKTWKRMQVAMNGIRGAERLAAENPDADLSKLKEGLERLAGSDLSAFAPSVRRGIRLAAEEAVQQFQHRAAATAASR